jgi:4-amino-4-deoxy-L-arabinose transferase
VIGPLLFLSASRGKLPTYSLPIFPPIAWLIVSGLLAGFKSQIPGTRIRGAFIPAAVLIMLGAGSMSLAIAGDWSAELLGRVWLESPQIHAVILGAALVLWGIGDWISQRCIPGPHRLMCMGLSPVAILASLSLLFPDAIVNDLTNSGPTLMSQRDIIRSASTLMCDQRLAHACAWFLPRSDFLIVSSPREFVNGLSIPQDDARIIASADFAAVLADARSRGSVVIAAETSAINSLMGTTGISAPTQRTDFRGWALVEFSPSSR